MRARTTACLGLVIAAGAALQMGACTSSNDTNTSNDAGAGASGDGSSSGNTITIGVSNSLTGGLKGIGGPLHNAWKVAEGYINAQGGVLGKTLKFQEIDDTSDDGNVIKGVANKLLGMNIAAVIGPNGSAQVKAVQDLFAAQKVIQISATATSTDLSTIQPLHDRYFFRTVPADSLQGRAVAKLASLGIAGAGGADAGTGAADGGAPPGACQRLALFYYTNAYGTPMADVIKGIIPQSEIVADVTVDSSVRADYSVEVGKIVAANPDCLAMVVYDDVGDKFLLQLRSALQVVAPAPLPFLVMGTDGVYTSTFIASGRNDPSNSALPTAVEGVYGTNPDTNPPDSQDYAFFKNLYTAQFPLPAGQDDIDAYASNEFDAAILIALAIQQAGGTADKVKLRESLYAVAKGGKVHGPGDFGTAIADIMAGTDIDYNGASGPVDLDDSGNSLSGYIFWKVVNGKFVTLKHVKAAEL
jgi:branched-chain amino acid transport system substrate-binding protein